MAASFLLIFLGPSNNRIAARLNALSSEVLGQCSRLIVVLLWRRWKIEWRFALRQEAEGWQKESMGTAKRVKNCFENWSLIGGVEFRTYLEENGLEIPDFFSTLSFNGQKIASSLELAENF